MRVLVTGARGFTGRNLVPLLRAQDDEVHELAADLTGAGAVRAKVAAARPEAGVHLAARTAVTDGVSELYRVNQFGTFALLDALTAVAPAFACCSPAARKSTSRRRACSTKPPRQVR